VTSISRSLSRSPARSLAVAVAVAASATFSLSMPAAHADEKVIATVNGKALTETDMKQAEQEIGQELGSLPEPTKRRVLIEFLIENQLFAEAATGEKLGEGAGFESRMQY